MKTSAQGIEAIKRFEGCKKKGDLHIAYQCSAGTWTIGYGSTRGVTPTSTCTEEQATERLRNDLEEAERAVRRNVSVDLNPAQFDALCSFTFNLGEGNLKKSTLLRLLNNKQYEDAAAQFPRWDWVNGQSNAGVRRRRLAEQAMFLTGKYPEKW